MSTPESGEFDLQLSDGCTLRGRLVKPNLEQPAKNLCLCVHGLAVDSNVWDFFAQRWLERGGSLLSFDLRGHGLSDRGKWYKFRPQVMAKDLKEACEKLSLKPDYLIAQSFGNQIALEILRSSTNHWGIKHYFAVTPVWTAVRPSLRQFIRTLREAFRFLRTVGKSMGFASAQKKQRRDHTVFADHPDSYIPRFGQEASSIGWTRYAGLMLFIQWSRWQVPYWTKLRELPVHIIGATDEGLWDNSQLNGISRITQWPLYWLEMKHISLSTDPDCAPQLMALIENEGLIG